VVVDAVIGTVSQVHHDDMRTETATPADEPPETLSAARWRAVEIRHAIIALAILALGVAVLLPVGSERIYGRTRTAVVAGPEAGVAQSPATTPWHLVGVVRQRASLLEGVRSALVDPPRHFAGDAGEPVGELVDSDERAHRLAETIAGVGIDAQVHLGEGSGNSAELVTTLAYLSADGTHDPAGCARSRGCLAVAATGTVRPDGSVGSVAAVPHKVAVARDAGLDVVFVPIMFDYADAVSAEDFATYRQLGEAHGDDTGTAVVAVRSVADALAWLCGAAGDPATCASAVNWSS
jgi:hypothetical protein